MKAEMYITIDTPEGKLTLSWGEARELYDILSEYFGKPKEIFRPFPANPWYPPERDNQPLVPGDWPRPSPIWCGHSTQPTPTE